LGERCRTWDRHKDCRLADGERTHTDEVGFKLTRRLETEERGREEVRNKIWKRTPWSPGTIQRRPAQIVLGTPPSRQWTIIHNAKRILLSCKRRASSKRLPQAAKHKAGNCPAHWLSPHHPMEYGVSLCDMLPSARCRSVLFPPSRPPRHVGLVSLQFQCLGPGCNAGQIHGPTDDDGCSFDVCTLHNTPLHFGESCAQYGMGK
jgi:hypothetical protein